MNQNTSSGLWRAVFSWLAVLWICYVFLGSLPYKFTRHPDTRHIFDTIGEWLGGFLGSGLGNAFSQFGSYAVGSFELLTALVLLAPAPLYALYKIRGSHGLAPSRRHWHAIGGLMAFLVMCGAVFFHLATPLGIEVLHDGKSDGGSLFYAAVSIVVLGALLFLVNRFGGQS